MASKVDCRWCFCAHHQWEKPSTQVGKGCRCLISFCCCMLPVGRARLGSVLESQAKGSCIVSGGGEPVISHKFRSIWHKWFRLGGGSRMVDAAKWYRFSFCQAAAAAQAGASVIQIFVGRLRDWAQVHRGDPDIEAVFKRGEDPGLALVTKAYNYINKYGAHIKIDGSSNSQ